MLVRNFLDVARQRDVVSSIAGRAFEARAYDGGGALKCRTVCLGGQDWDHASNAYVATDGAVPLGRDKRTAPLCRLSHLEGKYGPVGPFDLYVGAALEVLGRRLTLKQTADLATKTWVEAEAARLRRVQERLLDELRTYGREVGNLPGGGVAGSHRTTSASWGLDTGRRRVQNAVDRRQNASDPLRKLARDNEFLRLQVAEYRPVHGEV